MAMPVEERVRKASAARHANASRRRFKRYAEEMQASAIEPDIDTQDALAELLRQNGWIVIVDQ